MSVQVLTPGSRRRREGSARRLAAKEVAAGSFVREAPSWWDSDEVRPGEVLGWWDAKSEDWTVLVRGEPREGRTKGWQVVGLSGFPKRLLPGVEAREKDGRYGLKIQIDEAEPPIFIEGGICPLGQALPRLQASYGREGKVYGRDDQDEVLGVLWINGGFFALWKDGAGRAIGWEEIFGMREMEKGGSLTRKRKGYRVSRVLGFSAYGELGKRFFNDPNLGCQPA